MSTTRRPILPEMFERFLEVAKRAVAPVSLFHLYTAEALTNTYEDPKCPSYWRGSGCYDITLYAFRLNEIEVWARTPEEAVEVYAAQVDKDDEEYYQKYVSRNPDLLRKFGEDWCRRQARSYRDYYEVIAVVPFPSAKAEVGHPIEVGDCISLEPDSESSPYEIRWSESEPDLPTVEEALKYFKR